MAEMKQIGTNMIAEDFEQGENFKIGYFNIIHPGCKVGDNVKMMSNIELRPNTVIGSNVYIDSCFKSSGKNKIGNNTTLRYDSIIARGCNIGDGTYICPQVMTNNLNHKREQVGGAHIGKNCFIGTQTVLGAGITICDDVVVGSCSMVTKDITEPGIYVGVPAKRMM